MRKSTIQPQIESQPIRRPGFTIIELMVAVVIIAALAALLLPALQRSRRGVHITMVRNEISQLESSIAEFKSVFGVEPHSSVVLYEQASGWATDPKSRATIRGLWGNFDFSIDRHLNDDNANGIIGDMGDDMTDTFVLKGDQCLVFFLGGMYLPPPQPEQSGDVGELIGFSSNPRNPFDRTKSGTRVGPFFDFDPGRVKRDVTGSNYVAIPPIPMPDHVLRYFPVYVDPLDGQASPYLYASSYDGQGYTDTSSDSDINTGAHQLEPGIFRIYRTDIRPMSATTDPGAWKPKGFQIVSPGFDGKYGLGGPFKPDADIKLPEFTANVADPDRNVERDNITNFHSGELDP